MMAHGVAFICALVVSAAATRAPPGSWSTGSASGLPYSSFTCDVDGGVCYITGGFVSNQNGPYGTECATPAACVVLPGSNGSCPTMYAMQFGHMAHTSIVVNGSLWVLGGFCPTPMSGKWFASAQVEVYEAEYGFWNPKAVPPLPQLSPDPTATGLALTTALFNPLDDHVYVVGGATGGNEGLDEGCGAYLIAIDAASPSTWTILPSWVPAGTNPQQVGCGSAAALSAGMIFVAGNAFTPAGAPFQVLAALDTRNWGAGWTPLGPPNVPRSGASLIASAGALWLMGGEEISPGPVRGHRAEKAAPQGSLPIVELLLLANLSSQWELSSPMPGPTSAATTVLLAAASSINASLLPTPFIVWQPGQAAYEWRPSAK